jgi:hypothetical protein
MKIQFHVFVVRTNNNSISQEKLTINWDPTIILLRQMVNKSSLTEMYLPAS